MPNSVLGDTLLLTGYLDEFGEHHKFDAPESQHDSTGVQLVTFVFDWHGTRATVRLEKRTEYVTLTLIVDFSPYLDDQQKKQMFNGKRSPVWDAALSLEQLDRAVLGNAKPGDRALSDIHTCLHQDIWDEFFEDVLRPAKNLQNKLGDIFGDFRGLVLGSPYAAKWRTFASQPPFWREQSSRGAGKENGFWAQLFTRQRPTSVAAVEESRFSASETLGRYWPFLTTAIPADQMDFARHEFTACGMLKGRALYASALGAQPPLTLKARRFPHFYFLYCDTKSGWQIGRLIDRLHNLGTERLAALAKFDALRHSGYALNGIEFEIQEIKSACLADDGNIDIKHSKAEGELNSLAGKLSERIRDIEKGLIAINADVDGELERRIERSQYYILQFRAAIKPLRIKRIEGFQPYHLFVERRLGPAFSFIAALRAQYERIESEINALIQYRIAIQGRAVLVAARNRNRAIEDLQDFADYALWFVLIPYYAGTLFLSHIGGEEDCLISTQHHWMEFWGAMALIGLTFILTVRKRDQYLKYRRWLRFVLPFAVIAAAALIVFDQYWIGHQPPGADARNCHLDHAAVEVQPAQQPKGQRHQSPSPSPIHHTKP